MQFSNDSSSLLTVNKYAIWTTSSSVSSTASSSTSLISTWIPPTRGAHIFGAIFVGCGLAAFIINATVILTLCRLRRNILSHVFYILILNFAIIDLLKSICSVIWALKMLPADISTSMYFMKADQFALIILRFSNLATILNLLILTLNEYVCIIYPFHYRRLVTKAKVTLLIVVCWIAAWGLTLSILFLGSRKHSIFIKPDCLIKRRYFNNAANNATLTARTIAKIRTTGTATTITTSTTTNNISFSLHLPSYCFVRKSQISNNTEFIYNIFVIVFCFACLIISIACYSRLIRVISKIVKKNSSILTDDNSRTINDNTNCEFNQTKKQLLKRNKHIIVIGIVLAIYTVYLISYSAIKFLFVTRLKSSRLGISRTALYYVRWGFQTLMCLNALLQPLCYFRMHEFRCAFKTVIFRRNRCKSFIAEAIYLSIADNRRRMVLESSSRIDRNKRQHAT